MESGRIEDEENDKWEIDFTYDMENVPWDIFCAAN